MLVGCSRVMGLWRSASLVLGGLIGVMGGAIGGSVALGLILAEPGQPPAQIVLADDATPVTRYAADELVVHVQRSVGVTLPVIAESQLRDSPGASAPRIYLGRTRAALEAQLGLDDLPNDAFVLKAKGNHLFITGRRDGRDPLSEAASSHQGTLYGVYDLLERALGVRWLWPGELGTHVPRQAVFRIDPQLDERIEPAFAFRRFRSSTIERALLAPPQDASPLSFSPQGIERYAGDLAIYKKRHRLGDSTPKPVVGHFFAGWWEQYGEQHPEWFALNPEGRRGPYQVRPARRASHLRHVPMCVSNPELHRFIVEEAWDGGPVLRLGEVDRPHFCQCENCLAWDAPQPESLPDFTRNLYHPQGTSDRYARFWQTIYDLAVQRNPDVQVTTFLYWNYLPAPITPVALGDWLYGEFTPWGQEEIAYWPMTDAAAAWLKAQWLGWHRHGVQMAYRPNYFHGGYVMPHVSLQQVGDFLRFAAENGMIGFDQDMLVGHWATKGPMLYLHARLAAYPQLPVAQVLDEYYQAFGPAAEQVQRYFEHWEHYAAVRTGASLSSPVTAHFAYPPHVFEEPARWLAEAHDVAAAAGDPQYGQRVAFLQAGLEHARLAARFIGLLEMGMLPQGDPQRAAEARSAFAALLAFRREHEASYIADYVFAAQQEQRFFPVAELLREDAAVEEVSDPLREVLSDWSFRRDPQDRGMTTRWFEPRVAQTLRWEPIRVPAFWDHTAVGRYEGHGWYRCRFTLPAAVQGETLRLRFEGVDEQAWVFLGGQLIGEHTVASEGLRIEELWNRPFEVALPAALIQGAGPHELMVRVHNQTMAGGIWRPVRLWIQTSLE